MRSHGSSKIKWLPGGRRDKKRKGNPFPPISVPKKLGSKKEHRKTSAAGKKKNRKMGEERRPLPKTELKNIQNGGQVGRRNA